MARKKKEKSTKVVPSDESDSLYGLKNPGFEMGDFQGTANNISKFRDVAKQMSEKSNALQVISNVKQAASKWSNYVAKRRVRKQKTALTQDDSEKPKTGGIGLDDVHDDYVTTGSLKVQSVKRVGKEQEMSFASNRALIQYFAKLGQSKEDETLNLDFVDTLLTSGANINCCDKYGQTILHEVARAWHTDVARFLLEHGADVNQADVFGRTPLHIASAVDYPQMVNLLIEKGADKEAQTFKENQTPVHYAAKNDAVNSLKALIKQRCEYKLVKDFKGRTPIHVAAELDRSETARLLLDLQAPVGVSDNKGQKAITWMITKMAPVANEALQQFRTTDRPNRKQYYYLNLLVQDRELDPHGHTQTPLQVAVSYRQYDLLMDSVFRRLIDIMWQRYGRQGAWINLILNFVYICLWTAIGVSVEYQQRYQYKLPEQWWRIVLLLLAIGFTVWQVVEELREFTRSKRNHLNWVRWRTKEIEEDMEFCHPRWPEERKFLESELKVLNDLSPKYFSDYWNVFDWTCYFFLLVSITTHFVDIAVHSDLLARWHIRIMCVTIILLWLRLMKNVRAFTPLGPFIVIVGKTMGDVLRFLFLYVDFFLPYACAFWMIFGGVKQAENTGESVEVDGFQNIQSTLFSLFRLTLVDEYDYANMQLVDSLMAYILLLTWFALSAILCLNLLIALLSDTFQRVYDNAKANAVMQKAMTILNIWEGMSKKRRLKFLNYVITSCAPQSDYYDDDLTQAGEDDLKKVTIQIKEQLDELQEAWKHKFGGFESTGMLTEETGVAMPSYGGSVVTNDKFDHELHDLRDTMTALRTRHEDFTDRFRKDMKTMKSLLSQLVQQQGGPGFGGFGGHGGFGGQGGFELPDWDSRDSPATVEGEGRPSTSSSTGVRRLKRKKKSDLLALDESLPLRPQSPIIAPAADISTVIFPEQPDEEGTEVTDC